MCRLGLRHSRAISRQLTGPGDVDKGRGTDLIRVGGMQNAGDSPRRCLLLDEALGYAVRIRARAARRFNARRSSSLRPPQTP